MKKISDYASEAELALRALDMDRYRPESLYAPVSYALSAGGKRLRPALLMMAAESFGGESALELSRRPAAGIEMFHNFTLLHDDVMDCSELRRGRPTVHSRWDSNTAILSGDAMLTLAYELMADVDNGILREVLSVFNRMALDVYEGQSLDMEFEKQEEVDVDSYIGTIRRKTGALLGASARIGAMIGGASEKDASLMYEYGEMLGLAFQIQDDWLDTFGDAATFGKAIGGDIVNGKKTFLLVNALSRGNGDSGALRVAMKELEGDARIKVVTNIYTKMGLDMESRQAVAAYGKKALKALKGTTLSDEAREPFRLLVDKLTGRRR